jgi:hypothetical protein
MMVFVPILGNEVYWQAPAINEQALGRIVAAFKRDFRFISTYAKSGCAFVHCAFRRSLQIVSLPFPLRLFASVALKCALERAWWRIHAPVGGEGVLGPCGPRTGSSSGVRPGNSSGRAGSPGSCIGGGTSGRGLPGGLSCGGSDGWPGLIGGSSGGSIGISRLSGISVF